MQWSFRVHGTDFYPQLALDGMALDETYIWGGLPPEERATSAVGYLQTIYRVSDDLKEQGQSLARSSVERRLQEDSACVGDQRKAAVTYLTRCSWSACPTGTRLSQAISITPDTAASTKWRDEMRKMLAEKGYDKHTCEVYLDSVRDNRTVP